MRHSHDERQKFHAEPRRAQRGRPVTHLSPLGTLRRAVSRPASLAAVHSPRTQRLGVYLCSSGAHGGASGPSPSVLPAGGIHFSGKRTRRLIERAPAGTPSGDGDVLGGWLRSLTFDLHMIDRAKRDRLAEALRHLLSGRIDNLAFDDLDCPGGVTESDDGAIFEVFYSVWLCYDDFHPHPLRLTDGERLHFERCILFLHSDNEFEWRWHKLSGVVHHLRRVADDLTGHRFNLRCVQPEGDRAVWPFFRREDYDRALECPRLLRGNVQ